MYATLIATSELAEHLDDPNWVCIDCRFSLADTERGRRDYLQSHIPGAVYAHLDEDLCGPIIPGRTGRHPLPDPQRLAQTLGAWGVGPGVQVVVYDDFGGGIAARLWWMLRWVGHDAVALLDGGWPAWVEEGRATISGRETGTPHEFRPLPHPEMILSADDVERIRSDPAFCLIDSRVAERYRGESEPIDPVAGRIPGARNLSWPENVGPDGRFLAPAALRARFRAVLGEHPPAQTVFYCGSGVTACQNLLAMAYAGLGDAKLYAGSWSEWITDPQRPVARG